MMRRGTSILILAFAGLVGSCGEVDGTDPYALWSVFEHPYGAFHFHYLSPPWRFTDVSTPTRPVLVLDPDGDDTQVSGARGRVAVYVLIGTTVGEAARDEGSFWEREGYSVGQPVVYESKAGDLGILLQMDAGDKWVDAVFQRRDADVVTMVVRGERQRDRPDAELMEHSLEPRGANQGR